MDGAGDVDEHSMAHPFVDDDRSDVEDSEEPSGRRRWPVLVVAIVVVVVAIGAVLYVAASHYQPLSQSLNGGYGSQVLTANGALAPNRIVGGAGDTVVWNEPRGTFHVEVIVTLNNDQRFGVTIDKVLAPANAAGNMDVRAFFDSKTGAAGAYGYKGGPAFKATSLASKGQLQLAVHWSQPCVPASAVKGATTYTTLPVTYTFMGFRHTVNVPIDTLTITPRPNC
jgi:hypothetical protein